MLETKTSDDAWIFIPTASIFGLVLGFLSFASYLTDGTPPDTDFNRYIAPWLFVFVTILVFVKSYQLFFPVSYTTTIDQSQIVFQNSSSAFPDTVYKREDVEYFFTDPYRWHHGESDKFRCSVCQLIVGGKEKIDNRYVQDANREDFYTSVESIWGASYVRRKALE